MNTNLSSDRNTNSIFQAYERCNFKIDRDFAGSRNTLIKNLSKAERRVDEDGYLLPEWFAWARKGLGNRYHVRYPVGQAHRSQCLGSVPRKYVDAILRGEEPRIHKSELLSYIEARKEIYLPIYVELARKQPKFEKLRKMLEKGQNLMIVEIDGPHQESLEYYRETYSVGDDWIEEDSIEASERNMDIMLSDGKHAFGHGYCLAMALKE